MIQKIGEQAIIFQPVAFGQLLVGIDVIVRIRLDLIEELRD
jgi:hypothetical protein